MTEILNLKGKSNIVAKKYGWATRRPFDGPRLLLWQRDRLMFEPNLRSVTQLSLAGETMELQLFFLRFLRLTFPHFDDKTIEPQLVIIWTLMFWLMHLVMFKICKSNREDTSCLKTVRINFVATIHPKSTKMSFWSNIIRILIIYAGLTQNFLQFFSDTKTVSTNFFTFWMYASSPCGPQLDVGTCGNIFRLWWLTLMAPSHCPKTLTINTPVTTIIIIYRSSCNIRKDKSQLSPTPYFLL